MTSAANPASATINAAARPGSALPPEATVADRAKSDRWLSPWPNPWLPPMAMSTNRPQQPFTSVRTPAVTGSATAVPTAMITGAPRPRFSTEARSPRRAAAPTPTNRIGTDSQATTLSIARQGPANHDAKSGVVVACMAWTTPLMAQAAKFPIPAEIECPNQLATSWPRPPRGSKSEIPASTSAHRRAEVECPGDEEGAGSDDDRTGERGEDLVLGDRRPVDRPALHPPPEACPTDDQAEQAGVDGPLLDAAEERRHLGRTRQRVVRGDVEAGAKDLGSESRIEWVGDHRTSRALCRGRASRTQPMVQTNVTLNVTLAKETRIFHLMR